MAYRLEYELGVLRSLQRLPRQLQQRILARLEALRDNPRPPGSIKLTGENAYRILSNNCEHFCEWCLHGTSRSPQVEKWLGRPTRALLALMRRLVHIQPGAARGNAAGVSA